MGYAGTGALKLTNQIDNTLGHTKCARCLDTATQLYNLGAQLPGSGRGLRRVGNSVGFRLKPGKVVGGKTNEAGTDGATNQVLCCHIFALLRNLDLELTTSEP